MTLDQLRKETRPTVSVEEAAKALGIGRTNAWTRVRAGSFPVRTISVGRRVVVPTADLQRLLGAEPTGSR